nr:HD domain-containing protein [Endomicrobiaceae bacterium]
VDLLVDYCINGFDVTEEQLEYLLKLAEELNGKNIPYIATENDSLALKIFVNSKFNSIINEKQKEYPFLNTLSAKYTVALDISRDLARRIGEIENSNFVNLDELIEKELENYFFKFVDSASQKQIIGEQTKVIGLFADEIFDDTQKKELGLKGKNIARFSPKAIKYLLNLLGLDSEDTNKYKFINSYEQDNAKELFFEQISQIANGEQAYLLFSGHGFVDKIQVSKEDKEFISVEEFANALTELHKKGVDLSNITIDLSSCHSYFFALNMYEILKNNGVTTFPNIYTTAGFETPIGITTKYGEYVDSNSLISLIKVMEKQQKKEVTGFDLFKARIEGINANTAFFISGKNIEDINNNFEQDKIIELSKDKNPKQKSEINGRFLKNRPFGEMLSWGTRQDTNFEEIPSLPKSVFELSIFNSKLLSKLAPIWEELAYRAIPAFLASFMVSLSVMLLASAGFAGNILILSVISSIPGLIVFVYAQKKFIEAHLTEDWIKKQNLSKKQIWTLRIFGKFPSKELKKDFEKFSKKEQNKIKELSIKKTTRILAVPYAASMLLSFLIPVMPVIVATTSAATITAQVYHYKYNEKVDIENEFKYLEQLIANPDIAKEGLDLALASFVRKLEAIDIFKEEIKNLNERVTDNKVKAQIKEIRLEDISQNIDQINRYRVVIKRMEALLEQIENHKNNKDLEERFLKLTEKLCEELIKLYKDKTTSFHALRATKEAVLNPELSFREKYKLMIGGVLHDIGKNLVPDGILNKPDALTPEEKLVMNGHVWLGGCILKGSALYSFSNIVENHHYTDREDKKYNARSLTGNTYFSEQEDALARKFAVYDIFEAVSYKLSFSAERPYQLRFYPADLSEILFDMLIEEGFDFDLLEDLDSKEKIVSLISEINENTKERKNLIQQLISEIVRNNEIYSKSNKEIKNIIVLLSQIDKINKRRNLIAARSILIREKEEELAEENDKENINRIRIELSILHKEIKDLQREINERIASQVKYVMYSESANKTILEVRRRKFEAVREKGFGILTTLNIKTMIAKMLFPQEDLSLIEKKFINNPEYWQEQKQKFIKAFNSNPQAWYDKLWEMVDKTKIEPDKENFEIFLNFYFSSKDKKVSDDMLIFFSKMERFYQEKKHSEVRLSSKLLRKAKQYLGQIDVVGDTFFDKGSILSENMSAVNEMLQQGKSALKVATWIALQEADFSLSMKQDKNREYFFVRAHGQNTAGATELMNFIERLQNKMKWLQNIAPKLAEKIVRQASIIKHIVIDYKYIKASGIKEAINMFGSNTYLDENGNVHIPPVMIVDNLEQMQKDYVLENTGIKVNGRSVYRIKDEGLLIYGAQGIDGSSISKAINDSSVLKEAIEEMIREKGYKGIKVEVEGVIQEEGQEGISFEDGITIIGSKEIEGKSAEYITDYVSSSIEIKRSMGIMYSQKAFISLESITETEKLEKAIKQGRARKIISKEQYEQLELTKEEIISMKENGIEIYVDYGNDIANNLKEEAISGQVIREYGKVYIYDYYSEEETEIDEIGEEAAIVNIEDILVNSQKPIMIDIKVLASKLQKENILDAYKGLNTLIGNIKIRTGLGSISQADIENLAYNIDYNKIPELESINKENLKEATTDDLILLLQIEDNSEIGIILKAIRKNKDLDETRFIEIIKERVLAKAALKESDKEFGLKDKKLEIMLGKMLLQQIGNNDKQTVNIDDSFTGNKDNVIKKIMEETEKAMQKDEVAINTIIEIILVYGDSYKNKQMAKELDKNDARNYRAMLAAA